MIQWSEVHIKILCINCSKFMLKVVWNLLAIIFLYYDIVYCDLLENFQVRYYYPKLIYFFKFLKHHKFI